MANKLEGADPHTINRRWAEEIVNELMTVSGEELISPVTVTSFMAEWRLAREPGWSESTSKSWIGIEKSWADYLGDVSIGRLNAGHIAGYRDAMMRKGRSPKTVRGHIKYMRRILSDAVERGLISENPAAGVKLPKLQRKKAKHEFTLDQFKQLLNATDGEWHLLIAVGGLTGQRLWDCLTLDYSQIGQDFINFKRQKNDDLHVVPIHPALGPLIDSGNDSGPVFPELRKLPKTGSRSISAKFRDDILPRIGIVQEYAKNNNGNRSVSKYSFHSLRHMLSTELNRAGVSPETRMLIVGHEDAMVSAGYTHAKLSDAQRALAMVAI